MVENALYQDARVIEVAAVGVPDQRLGELVTAVVYAHPSHLSQLTESDLIALSRRRYVPRVTFMQGDILNTCVCVAFRDLLSPS